MKILLPVDGSSHSLNAARFVVERLLPNMDNAELQVLHVHYRIPPRAAAAVGREAVESYYRSETEAATKSVEKLLKARNIPHVSLRLLGYPGLVIPKHAEETGADLVVMGSHGMGTARGLLLGSVTQAVIGGCSTPLLVVRDGPLPPPGGEVLVAVDDSAVSRRAFAWLLRRRAAFAPHKRITLMHVTPPPPRLVVTIGRKAVEQQQRLDAGQAMRGALRLAAKVRMKCKTVLASGDPGERIADHARGKHSGLIVMGSHGRGGMTSLLLGSVAQKTLATGRTPVLIVR